MVPGMTERERLAVDVRRLAWLADVRFGPATDVARPTQLKSTSSLLTPALHSLATRFHLGKRLRLLPRRVNAIPKHATAPPH
jgi:hypothetical protein